MADAETFMLVLGICYVTSESAYSAVYHAEWCARQAVYFGDPKHYGTEAARAAFRAVPALRGA